MAAIALPLIGNLISGIFGLGAGQRKAKADQQAASTIGNAGKDVQNFTRQELAASNAELNPFITGGQGAFSTIAQLMQQGAQGQGPLSSWTGNFQAPTAAEAMNNPAIQAQLDLGTRALENSAAARGGLLSAGTGRQLTQFGNELGAANYQQVYNNAMQQYQQQYAQFQNNQSNLYNRLMGIGQTGLGAAQTSVGANMQGAGLYGQQGLTAAEGVAGYQAQAGGAKAIGLAGLGNSIGNAMGAAGGFFQPSGPPPPNYAQNFNPATVAGGMAYG